MAVSEGVLAFAEGRARSCPSQSSPAGRGSKGSRPNAIACLLLDSIFLEGTNGMYVFANEGCSEDGRIEEGRGRASKRWVLHRVRGCRDCGRGSGVVGFLALLFNCRIFGKIYVVGGRCDAT